jgi:hypothetical protein
MPLRNETRGLLSFLQKNPGVRARIAAPPDATLLYAGSFFRPMWQEIEQLKRSFPQQLASKRTLPEILGGIPTPGQPHSTLLAWAKAIDGLQPWKENGFIAWRALSGIFASNASGKVSFCIGSNVTKADRVFAATELPVLLRNPGVDAVTKDLLAYYDRCVKGGQSAMTIGFIAG